MDRLLSPEKELSLEDIPDLNVKSYYGQDIPAVQDDFGDYSYSDSSTSPETYNGGVSNLSEDSLDNRLISSGLAEESEVPIIESANVYNDSLCDVTNSSGFIDDILGNLGPSVCGGTSSGTEADLDREDEANNFSCGESRCSCQGCRDSCKESLTSPLAVSDDSSSFFTSSCDSFDYPFLQTITEYLDTKLTLSAPDTKFSVPQLVFRFPPMSPNNYSYDKSKEKWKLKQPLMVECDTVIMTSRELSYKREESKMLLKEFPGDIVFPNTKFNMPHKGYIEGASVSLGSDNSDKLNSLCDPIVSIRSPSSNLIHETSGNIPLMELLSPAVVPSDTDYTCDSNVYNIDCEPHKKPNNKSINEIPYEANELSDALRNLESVKYSLESNHSDFTSNNCLKRSVTAILNSLDQRNSNSSSDLTYDKFKSNLVKTSDSSSVELPNTSNVISVGENVITCKNPVVFSDSYSVKNYDDNGYVKDSNPNSVEEFKHHNEESQDGNVRQAKNDTLVSKEIDSDVINDAALLFRLANSFDSFNSQQIKSSSFKSSLLLDMPSLSPEPNTTPPKSDKLVPPTLTPQASFKTKEEKQKRKQNKDKISHNVPLKLDVTSESSDRCKKSAIPELMNFDMTNLKENSNQQGQPSVKSVKVLKKLSEEKPEEIFTDKKTVCVKKSDKKNHSVPKSFILGKVFPKNRVTKPEKAPLAEVIPVNGLDNQHDNEQQIKTEAEEDTSNQNPISIKTNDKKSIVVSMVNNKNAMNKAVTKKKDDVTNSKKSDHICKSPSFCSKNHKLVVFKKNPSILEKITKKQTNEDCVEENNSCGRINGFKTEPIMNKTDDVIIDKASENKNKIIGDSDNIILSKEVMLTPRLLSPTKLTPDKSNINLESSKNITENVSEKAAYPKSKSSLIRQKTESVVAEADSTGPDTSIIEKNISDVIINNRPNLIIQNDSGSSQVGVSNEIHLKQTDSVRLLLDPGHLSHNKITSMVITVATAEISCNINETDCHTIPSISGKPSVTAQIIDQPKKSSKSEKPSDSDSKSKHIIKKERISKDRSSSQESLRDDKNVVKTKSGLESSSPSRSKEVDSVSSTSNVVEPNRSKSTRTSKLLEEKYDVKNSSRNNKMFNYLDIVTNLRKRSSSCGSTIKGRRYSSETLKHILPIKCSIELDLIKCKTFSLSDTCVSSIYNKDSGKTLSVGSKLTKCDSIPALKTDRNDRVEVSSSTSPGKDDRSDGDATPLRDEVNIKKPLSPLSSAKNVIVKSSSKPINNESKSNSENSRKSSCEVSSKTNKSKKSNHHDDTVKSTNPESIKSGQVTKQSESNESISDRVRSRSSGDIKSKKCDKTLSVDKSIKSSEKAKIVRSKSEVIIAVSKKPESGKKSKDKNGNKFYENSKMTNKETENSKMSLRDKQASEKADQIAVEKSNCEDLKAKTNTKDDFISSRRSGSGSSSRALSKELRELTKELKELTKDSKGFNKDEENTKEYDKRKPKKDSTSDKEFKAIFSTPNTRSTSHLNEEKPSDDKIKPITVEKGSDSNNIRKDAIKSSKISGENKDKTNNFINNTPPTHSTRSSGSVDLSDVKPSNKRKTSQSESEVGGKNNSKTSSAKKNDNNSNDRKTSKSLQSTRSSSSNSSDNKSDKKKTSKSECDSNKKDVLKDTKMTCKKDKEKDSSKLDTVKAVISSPSTRSSITTLNITDSNLYDKRKSSRSSSESDKKDASKDMSKNLSKKQEDNEDRYKGDSKLSSPNTRSSSSSSTLVSDPSSDKRNPRSRKSGCESESKSAVLENADSLNSKSFVKKDQDTDKNESHSSKLTLSDKYEEKVKSTKNNLVKTIQDKLKNSLTSSLKENKNLLDNNVKTQVGKPKDNTLSSVKDQKTEVETLALNENAVSKTTLRSGGKVDNVELGKTKYPSSTVKTKAALKAFTSTVSEDKEKHSKNQVSKNNINNEKKEKDVDTVSKDLPNKKLESKSRSSSLKRANIIETSVNNANTKKIEENRVDVSCPKKKIKTEEHSSKTSDLKLFHNTRNKDAIKSDTVTSKTSNLTFSERMSLRKHKISLEDNKDSFGKNKIADVIPEKKIGSSERNQNNSKTPQRETIKESVENKDKERTSLRLKSSQENLSQKNNNHSTDKKDGGIVSLISPKIGGKILKGESAENITKKSDWIDPPRDRKGKFIKIKRSRSSPPRVLNNESEGKSCLKMVDGKSDEKLKSSLINRKLRSSSNWGSNDSLASSVSDDQKSVDSASLFKSGQQNTNIPSRPSRRSQSHSESSDISENSSTLSKTLTDPSNKISDPKKTSHGPNLPDGQKDISKSNISEDLLDKSISPQVRRSSLRSNKLDLMIIPSSNDLPMDVSDIPLPSNQPPSRRSSPRCASRNKFNESNSLSSFSVPIKEPKLNDKTLKNEIIVNKKESTSPKEKTKDSMSKNISNLSKLIDQTPDAKSSFLSKEIPSHGDKTSTDVSVTELATPVKTNEIDENLSERRSLRIQCRLQSSLSPSRPSLPSTVVDNDTPIDSETPKPEFTSSDLGVGKTLNSDYVIPELIANDSDTISKEPTQNIVDMIPVKKTKISDEDNKESTCTVEKFSSGKNIFKAIFGSENSLNSVNPEPNRNSELGIDSTDIIEVEIHENSVLEPSTDFNHGFSENSDNNVKASDGKFVRRSLRKYHVKETTPSDSESLAEIKNPKRDVSDNQNSSVETITVISKTDHLKNYEVTEITTISVTPVADVSEKVGQLEQEPVSVSVKEICNDVPLNTRLSSGISEELEKDKSHQMLSEVNSGNLEPSIKLSNSIINCSISISQDDPSPLNELMSNRVSKNIPKQESMISPLDKLVVATELTELIVSPVEAVVHSNNDDISVSGSLNLLAESACHMKKAKINKSIQSKANDDQNPSNDDQNPSNDTSDSKNSNVQSETKVDENVEKVICSSSSSSESIKNEEHISSNVETLNICNDSDLQESTNTLQPPVNEASLISRSSDIDLRDELTAEEITGDNNVIEIHSNKKEDVKENNEIDAMSNLTTIHKESNEIAIPPPEVLIEESSDVCVDEIRLEVSGNVSETLISDSFEAGSSKTVCTKSSIPSEAAAPCKAEESVGVNSSGPLYEAIIANTNDYALVSPASDTIVISHDVTTHVDDTARNIDDVSVVPIDCSIEQPLKTQFLSFDAQTAVGPSITQETICEQYSEPRPNDVHWNLTLTGSTDSIQPVQSSDNTVTTDLLVNIKPSNNENKNLINTEFQETDVNDVVQDVSSCGPINSVVVLNETPIGHVEGDTVNPANSIPTDKPLILESSSAQSINGNETATIGVEELPCKDDSDRVSIEESHAIVTQNLIDLKTYVDKESNAVEPIIESFVGVKSDYDLVLISDVHLQIPIEKKSVVTIPEEIMPSESGSQRLAVLNLDSESESSIIPLDKDSSKDFNIELTDTDIDSLAQLQSGVDKQFYKDTICQAASSESILNKDLLDSQNQSDPIAQIETIIASSDSISSEIPFDYGTNSVSSCLVDERSINIPETGSQDPISNVTLDIDDSPVVDLSDDVNNLKDDELSDYLSTRNLERADSDPASQLNKSNDLIQDILLDWSGEECDSSRVEEEDDSVIKSQQDKLLTESHDVSYSEIASEEINRPPINKTDQLHDETNLVDFNYAQGKDPVVTTILSTSSDKDSFANPEYSIKPVDNLSISVISSINNVEKDEATEMIAAESNKLVTESVILSSNQSSDSIAESIVAVFENPLTTETVNGIPEIDEGMQLTDSNVVPHDATESITVDVFPENSTNTTFITEKNIKSPLLPQDVVSTDISVPLIHVSESLPQGTQTLESTNVSAHQELCIEQLAETENHSLTDSSGEKDLSYTEEVCVEQELIITDEYSQQEFKEEIKLNEEVIAGGKSDVLEESDIIVSSSSLDSGDTNLQTEATSTSDNLSDQTLVTVSSGNSSDESNEHLPLDQIQSPVIATEDKISCVEEGLVTTMENIVEIDDCKGNSKIDKGVNIVKDTCVRLESEINSTNENDKDLLEIGASKEAEVLSSDNVLVKETNITIGNRSSDKLFIGLDNTLNTVDSTKIEVGIKEASSNMSPDSSPSEALPISPLSVTVYNSSDDTDASPVAKINSYPPVKYSINSSHRTVESHVDVTVVNPEEPVENIPSGVSKTSPIDIVVVSPSGDVVSSPNDSSVVISVDEKLDEKSTNNSVEISSKSEEANVSTQEEILNELMSSVVSSKPLNDGSESENSPKPDLESKEAAHLSPSPLGSPYSLGSPGSMGSPNSIEIIANYRKRKIKAVPETDFVKKCKRNKNSGNIIIHSSEDEDPQDKKTPIRRKSIGKDANIQRHTTKHIERNENKISNPYSKVFYHNRSNKNKDDSEFSFKTLFSSRRGSCNRSSISAKIPESEDNVIYFVTNPSELSPEVSKPGGHDDSIVSDLSENINVQQNLPHACIEKSSLPLEKSDSNSKIKIVSKDHVAALPIFNLCNEIKPATSRSRSLSCSSNSKRIRCAKRSKSLVNIFINIKEPALCDSSRLEVDSPINKGTTTPDRDTCPLTSLPLKDVRVVLKKIETSELSKFNLDNLQDYLTGSNGTTESGGINDLGDNIAEFRSDDNSSSSLNRDSKKDSAKDKSNPQGSRPPNSSRPVSPSVISVNNKVPLIKMKKLSMGNLSSVIKDNGLKTVNIPAFFLHLKDDKTVLKGFKHKKSLNWFVDISDEGTCFKVKSDHNNTCEVVYIKEENIHHRHLNIDNCGCPFAKRLNSKFTGWDSLKEDLEKIKSDKPSAPKPLPVPKKIRERKERDTKRKKGRHRLTTVKPKPVWNPPSDIELQRKRMKEIEMAAGTGSSQSLRDSVQVKQSSDKVSAPLEYVVVGRVKSLETQEPTAYIPIPSHHQQQLKRTDARYVSDLPSSSFDPIYPFEFPIRPRSSFPRPRDVELDISSVKGLMKARKGELSSSRDPDRITSFDAPLIEEIEPPEQCLITDSMASPQIDETFSLTNELAGCPLLNYNDFVSERSFETSHEPLNRLTTNPVPDRQPDKRRLESTQESTKRMRLEDERERWESSSKSLRTTAEVHPVGSQAVGSVRLKDKSLLLQDKTESSTFNHRDRKPKKVTKCRELFLKQQEMKQQWAGLRQLSLTRLIGVALGSSQRKEIKQTVNVDMVQEFEGVPNRILCLYSEGALRSHPPVEVVDEKISKPIHDVWVRKKSNEEKKLVLERLKKSHDRKPVFTSSSCKTDQGNNTIDVSVDIEMRSHHESGDKDNFEADPVIPEHSLDRNSYSPDSINSEDSDRTVERIGQPYLRHNWSHWPPGSVVVFDPATVDGDSPAAVSHEPDDPAVPEHPSTFPHHI